MQPNALSIRSQPPRGRRYKKTAIQAIIGLIIIIFVATIAFTIGNKATQEVAINEPLIKTSGVNLMPQAIAQLPSDYTGMAVQEEPEPASKTEPVEPIVEEKAQEQQGEKKPSKLEQMMEDRRIALLEESWEAAESGGTVEGISDKVKEMRPAATGINSNDYNYLNHNLVNQVSPYVLTEGSIIPAVLLTGINSDLASPITAMIRENVYDSVTGDYLLIPQGARLIGTYNDVQVYNQERVFITWNRVILPNGDSIKLGDMTGVDMAGYAGLRDKVNHHTWALIKGVLLGTLLTSGSNISTADNDVAASFQRGFAQSTNQALDDSVQRALTVEPTITVRPGARLNVMVQKDIILKPYES